MHFLFWTILLTPRGSIGISVSFAVYITEPGRFLFRSGIENAYNCFCAAQPSRRCETRLWRTRPQRFASNLVSINEIIQKTAYMVKLFAIAVSHLEKLPRTATLFRVPPRNIFLVKMFISYRSLRGIQLISFLLSSFSRLLAHVQSSSITRADFQRTR